VIPVAGLGTRLLPASKAIPKEMVPIVDKPVIQYVVEEALSAGIEEIIFVNSMGKTAIEDHFDHHFELETKLKESGKAELFQIANSISEMVRIVSVRQKVQKGLGHAVYCAHSIIGDEPFAVLLGDDLFVEPKGSKTGIGQCIELAAQHGTSVVGMMEVKAQDVSKYGIASVEKKEREGLYQILDLVEKPDVKSAPSRFALPGRYVLDSQIFEILEKTNPGSGGEIQLTDALSQLAHLGRLLGWVMEGERFDAGNKLGFLEATIHFAMRREEFREPLRQMMLEALNRY